ncbi:MAG: hypothetical protein ACI9FN_000243 [Saprospiraceae bacterium]|jgi:hypothetical protein
MDKLEKHISQNREAWDDKKAPDFLWNKIEMNLEPTPKSASKGWIGYVIVGIGIGLFATFLLSQFNKEQDVDTSSSLENPMEFAQLEDFQETEHYYQASINMSMEELKKMKVDATLMDDLSQLDKLDKQLRKEYKAAQNGYKEQILHALIMNHQTKLGLLERVLTELKNTNEDEIF